MSDKGRMDFTELQARHEVRKELAVTEVLGQNKPGRDLSPFGKIRECRNSDKFPKTKPFAWGMDVTGSVRGIPVRMAQNDLRNFLQPLLKAGVTGGHDPQVCMCAVADYAHNPLQVGQFETDLRMDDDLTAIKIGGGGGSEYMHEAYEAFLYWLAFKVEADVWKTGGKGHAYITGDELPNAVFTRDHVAQVFGDQIIADISIRDLIAKVQERWHLSFLYAATGYYEDWAPGSTETIWTGLQGIFGNRAFRLDENATGVAQIACAISGIDEGVLTAKDAVIDQLELGTEERICRAMAETLQVDWDTVVKRVGADKAAVEQPRRRGPKVL